jgi:hypothetical protein
MQVLATAALIWSIASSLWCFPHSLSYFNELVGGPEHGGEHLLDSSIAWGQDLLYLKDWYDANPEARPFYLATSGFVDPRVAGIEFMLWPLASTAPGSADSANEAPSDPPLGWYAIDVNYLCGSASPAANGHGGRTTRPLGKTNHSVFNKSACVSTVGHSIYIYRVTLHSTAEMHDDLRTPRLQPVESERRLSHQSAF